MKNEQKQLGINEKRQKKEKTGQPEDFFSLLCFVFFIYKRESTKNDA